MSAWYMKSDDGVLQIAFATDDSTGAVSGTLIFQDVEYGVSGNWGASGSIPGRDYSAFAIYATEPSGMYYLGMVGTIQGPGSSPTSMQVNLNRADCSDGFQLGYDAVLMPTG